MGNELERLVIAPSPISAPNCRSSLHRPAASAAALKMGAHVAEAAGSRQPVIGQHVVDEIACGAGGDARRGEPIGERKAAERLGSRHASIVDAADA